MAGTDGFTLTITHIETVFISDGQVYYMTVPVNGVSNVASDDFAFNSTSSCACVDTAAGFWLCAESLLPLSDSTRVSTWTDLSTNGNDAVTAASTLETAANNKPLFRTNQQNSLPAIDFGIDLTANSTTNFQVPHDASVNMTTAATVIMVINADTITNEIMFMKGGSSPSNQGFTLRFNSGKATIQGVTDVSNRKTTVCDNAVTAGNYTVITFRVSGHTQEMWYDSALQSTTSASQAGTVTSMATTLPISIGCGNNNSGVPSGGAFNGFLAEVAFYTSSLSDVDRAAKEACLISRYNL